VGLRANALLVSGSTHPVVSLLRTTWVGVSGREARYAIGFLPNWVLKAKITAALAFS